MGASRAFVTDLQDHYYWTTEFCYDCKKHFIFLYYKACCCPNVSPCLTLPTVS